MSMLEPRHSAVVDDADPATLSAVARGPQVVVERPEGTLRLLDLPADVSAVIARVEAPGPSSEAVAARLAELGFLPGERVRVVARAALGGPLAIRVGTGTFALRREEAACVRVWPGATVK